MSNKNFFLIILLTILMFPLVGCYYTPIDYKPTTSINSMPIKVQGLHLLVVPFSDERNDKKIAQVGISPIFAVNDVSLLVTRAVTEDLLAAGMKVHMDIHFNINNIRTADLPKEFDAALVGRIIGLSVEYKNAFFIGGTSLARVTIQYALVSHEMDTSRSLLWSEPIVGESSVREYKAMIDKTKVGGYLVPALQHCVENFVLSLRDSGVLEKLADQVDD